jgi:hypothetical protein
MQKLSFDKRTQSDIDLEVCQKHSDLAVLNLTRSMVLGYGFEYLLDNHHLSELYLCNTPIQSRYMNILARLPALEFLDISDTGVDDEGMQALSSIPRLKTLVANQVKSISDAGLIGFDTAACANVLQRLSLNATAIGDEAALLIGKLGALKILSLASTGITTAGALALKGLLRLQHLDLSYTLVGDSAMESLAALGELRAVNLTGTPVSPVGVKSLAAAPSLNKLSLSLAYGDGIVESLADCKKMETLNLFDGRLDTGMAALKKVDSLRALELVYVNLTSQALSELKQLKQLELLVMDRDHSPLAKEMHKALPACMIRFED